MYPPCRILAHGPWRQDQVVARFVPSTRRSTTDLDAQVDDAWETALAQPGIRLFDGPMMRLESFYAASARLTLALSPTNYRPFYVLHILRNDLRIAHPQASVNPLGVSAALVSADGDLLLGRRSSNVAYYPDHIHPFAGTLEPRDHGNPFTGIARELTEELGLGGDELHDWRLLALVEEPTLHQPEAILFARTTLPTSGVRARLRPDEHDALIALRPFDIPQGPLTPVAQVTVALFAAQHGDNAPPDRHLAR